MMTKNGRIEPGKTPSAVSALPSNKVVNGEAVRGKEKPSGLKKIASKIPLD